MSTLTVTSLIETKGLSLRLNGEIVLRDIDFRIKSGEIITIVGPNGAGKSSLLRVLIGAVTPTTGKVYRKPRLRLGYVPQKLEIDQTLPLTVLRFLKLPVWQRRSVLDEALISTDIAGLADRQMSELSGGQFQRVLLARAILEKPQILLLDEAAQGLDQNSEVAFYKKIEELRRDLQCAVLMVSHDLRVVMSASDRVICLNKHICCEGSPEVISSNIEWQKMFGTIGSGALALYRHDHSKNNKQALTSVQ
ncbi:MAG: metal ABC transporter ATP-binding protein [Aestuariivita sp.]|nr:metal ABC transporter ATP-binding protein [Aestuariivita sp.]